jgi:hypothetical protein
MPLPYSPAVAARMDPDTPENRHLRAQFARNHPDAVDGTAYRIGRSGAPCPYIEGPEAEEWRRGAAARDA